MRNLFIGFFFGVLTLAACASIEYNHYGLTLPDACYDQGTMLGRQGKDGWPDIPFSACKPDQQVKGKCVLMKSNDYFKMDQALLECEKALSDCQKGSQ